MKTWRWTLVLAVGLLLFTPLPSQAERHGFHGGDGHQFHGGHGHFRGGGPRFFVGVGPVWPAPWWYYPAPAYVYTPPPGCRRPAAAGLRGATATVLVLLPEFQRLLSA